MRGRGDDGTTLCRHRRRFLGQDGQRLLQDIRSGLLVFSSRKGFLILSAGVAVPGSSKRARRLGQSAGASSRNPISVPWPLIAPTHHHHFFSVTSDFALCCTLKLILYAYLTAFPPPLFPCLYVSRLLPRTQPPLRQIALLERSRYSLCGKAYSSSW